ncbi:MAG: Hint domain-containing protein [Pseudomonadota bacterium]
MTNPHISEFRSRANDPRDFVEIRVDSGTDVSDLRIVLYEQGGSFIGTVTLGSVKNTVAGSDVYSFSGWQTADAGAYGLYDVSTGETLQFVSSQTTITAASGPLAGQTSQDVGKHKPSESLQSDDGGNTYYTQSSPNRNSVPCFAPGTVIDTPDGPRPVETLKVGDLVTTRDRGPQSIRWTHSAEYSLDRIHRTGRPVSIAAGALAANVPVRDMIVSPQHRIVVGCPGQLPKTFPEESLAPAKALSLLPGIRHMMSRKSITWVHFAFERHEIVCADGCWTESLLLGPMVLNGLSKDSRDQVINLFAATADTNGGHTALNGPVARPCLTVRDVHQRIAILKNGVGIAA